MYIRDLINICDSFDSFTEFFCYDIKSDYESAGVAFAKLNKMNLYNLYGDFKIIKFYIYSSNRNRVDLLFYNPKLNLK